MIGATANIGKEAQQARRGFKKLREVPISFLLKDRLPGGSIMMAQPVFADLFKPGKRRRYRVLVRRSFNLGGERFTPSEIPPEIRLGWFAHELGHIVDYRDRSNWGLIRFGWQYIFSGRFRKSAERRADAFAVEAGFGPALIATKNFILNHTRLPEVYKKTIRTYYPSPDEILEMEQALQRHKTK
ncbi:MAG: hypothetical protein P8Z38_04600 [Robiginitalea sp.]|jgi:hypothetical protein